MRAKEPVARRAVLWVVQSAASTLFQGMDDAAQWVHPSRDTEDHRPSPPLQAWLETAALTALAVGLSYLVHPNDPFCLHASFPWIVLAPLLAGLRFGFAAGCGAAIALDVAILVASTVHRFGVLHFPGAFAVGLVVVGMLAGEFCDAYLRRLGRLQSLNAYRRDRLDEFTRTFYVLKSSHDQLEQRLAGSGISMRDALSTARRQFVQSRVLQQSPPGFARSVLLLLARYGFIQAASLHLVAEGRAQEAVATLGEGKPIELDDPMLVEAIRSGVLVSVDTRTNQADWGSQLLAAIPLADVTGRVWAVMAVREMLFVAFQDENLRLLSVLSGHLGDLLADAGGLAIDRDATVQQMDRALRRSLEDARRYRLPGAFLRLTCRGSSGQRLAEQVLELRRALDQAVVGRSKEGDPLVLLLLPLTDRSGLDGYLARLKKTVGPELASVEVQVTALTGTEKIEELMGERHV